MNALWLLVLGGLIALTTTTAVSLHRRVVGGRLLLEDEHPYLVSLWFMPENPFTENTKLHHLCGGTLIRPDWVLTAAHCFDEDIAGNGTNDPVNWKVVIGKHNQRLEEDTNQLRRIKTLHIYDKWNTNTSSTQFNVDAALLELDEPVDMSREGVDDIDYDRDAECAVPGAQCFVLGWGQVAESPHGYGMDVPVGVDMPVWDSDVCIQAFNFVAEGDFVINDTVLCAGHSTDGVGPCFGDSGGPLACQCNGTVVSGIMSGGYGCARAGFYALFTRVNLLKDWIHRLLDGEDPQTPVQTTVSL